MGDIGNLMRSKYVAYVPDVDSDVQLPLLSPFLETIRVLRPS